MKKQHYLTLVAGLFLFAACSSNTINQSTSDSSLAMSDSIYDSKNTAHADISGTKPDTIGSGTADFIRLEKGGVQLKLKLNFPVLANKNVSVHIHEHGDCGDAGNMAHGHWNPTNELHGKWGASAYHSGDIGNVKLDGKGLAELTIETLRWTIGGDSLTNVLDRGIIVHSGTDDYKSQPAGNSGSRIGCGIIK